MNRRELASDLSLHRVVPIVFERNCQVDAAVITERPLLSGKGCASTRLIKSHINGSGGVSLPRQRSISIHINERTNSARPDLASIKHEALPVMFDRKVEGVKVSAPEWVRNCLCTDIVRQMEYSSTEIRKRWLNDPNGKRW